MKKIIIPRNLKQCIIDTIYIGDYTDVDIVYKQK